MDFKEEHLEHHRLDEVHLHFMVERTHHLHVLQDFFRVEPVSLSDLVFM